MSNIENRVVSLEFNNADFQEKLEQTLSGLERLQASLDFSGAQGSFEAITDEAGRVDLSGIGEAVDSINSKFSAMGAIGFTVIQSITRGAMNAASALSSATLGVVVQGGKRRSLAIEQAKFQFEGLGQDVDKSMKSALDAVRGTAYGLDEAATVAASFGASGIAAGTDMTEALRGVAGVAALTGTSFADMGSIFQDVAGSGKLTGAHLFSFASRGINMAANLSKEFGVTEEAVREMATNGEISFEKFASAVDGAFGEHAQSANKTYAGSLANMRAALSRLGATFFDISNPVMRDIFNSTTLAIDNMGEALKPVFGLFRFFMEDVKSFAIAKLWSIDFSAIGKLISDVTVPLFNAFKTVGYSIGRVLGTIGSAFTSVFGNIDAGGMVRKLVEGFTRLSNAMVPSYKTLEKVKSVAAGVFAIFSIVWEVVKGVAGVFKDLFTAIAPVGSGLADVAAGFGDTMVNLKEFLVDGGRIAAFFDDIGAAISTLISGGMSALGDILADLGGWISGIFDGLDSGARVFGRVSDRMDSTGGAATGFASKFMKVFDGIRDFIGEFVSFFQETFEGFGESLGSSLEKGNFSEILDVLNIGALGGVAFAMKKFVDAFSEGITITKVGWTEAMEVFGDTLGALQGKLKSEALKNIAIAVGILTISIVALSLIDSVALTKAMVAIAAGFGVLIGAFTLLSKAVDPKLAYKMIGMSIGLIALSVAMLILSVPVYILSRLGWGELARGLLGLAGMLAVVVTAAQPLAKGSKGLFTASVGLGAMAVALLLMVTVLKRMAELSWGEMAKGLAGVAGALVILVVAANSIQPAQMIAVGAGLLLMSVGLLVIAEAMKRMADLSWTEMGKGLVGLAGALVVLVVASNFAQSAIGGAIAIAIMSASLLILAEAMKRMATLSWEEIGKGLVITAAALAIFVLAAYALGNPAAIAGLFTLAIALPALSAGLLMFAGVMQVFSGMSWGDFAKGLGMIAIALTVLGLAAYALLATGATVAILALAGALLILGIAVLAFGAGLFLAGKGLEALAAGGEAGIDVYVNYLKAAISLIPVLATELAEGVIAFVDTLLDAAPSIIEGLVEVFGMLLDGLMELAPKVGETATVLILELLAVIQETSPEIIDTVIQLIQDMLQALIDALPEFCRMAGELIGQLRECLLSFGEEVLGETGMKILGFLIDGLKAVGRFVAAGARLIGGIVTGIAGGIGRLVSTVVGAVGRFISTVAGAVGRAVSAGASFMGGIVTGVASKVGELVSKGGRAIADFVNDMAAKLAGAVSRVATIAGNIATAIKDGVMDGIGRLGSLLTDKLRDMAGSALDAVKGVFGIGSPSKEFNHIGQMLMVGWSEGVAVKEKSMQKQLTTFGDGVVTSFADISKRAAETLADMDEVGPTITPVLDLSLVTAQARGISDILGNQALLANSTFAQADQLNSNPADDADAQTSTDGGPATVIFEQHNHSPKALTVGKIYRQTQSQIEMAKEGLKR